jgi:hypothetical protein
MKLYVIPTAHLRTISSVYIPADGKYAGGGSKKPQKDWTRYEEAWHLLDSATRAALATGGVVRVVDQPTALRKNHNTAIAANRDENIRRCFSPSPQ